MGAIDGSPDVIAIGAGVGGIALAYELKHRLGFDNFMIYEKMPDLGGVWWTNTYPGCGCDVSTQLYSFSFNLKSDWPADLCDQPQILEYINDTVDKFNLRPHMMFNIECLKAQWLPEQKQWRVTFRNVISKTEFVRHATAFISNVGILSNPKHVPFEGNDTFKGESFHSARWNHNYDITGKRMAIIGNGCSAVQLLPNVIDKVAYVKQYARSAQWYHARPNHQYSAFERFCFKYVPLYQRYVRLSYFLEADSIVESYVGTKRAAKIRAKVEKEASDYILAKAPKKYHSFIVPDFPLGCKRRVFDGGYLDALHALNVELVTDEIVRITENGIVGSSGKEDQFDVIVYATGFRLSDFLLPMEVVGSQGVSLAQQWKEDGGAQAFFGTFVHNFPNFAMMFGPNVVPAHGSAVFAAETIAEYIGNKLVAPIIDRRADIIEVKQVAENEYADKVHRGLNGAVFTAGCSNWYFDEFGRNVAHWHGYSSTFCYLTLLPQAKSFFRIGGSALGNVNRIIRWIRTTSRKTWSALIILILTRLFKL